MSPEIKLNTINFYIIFPMFFVLFFFIFFMEIKKVTSLVKIFLSEKEIIPFERYYAPLRAKIGTNDVTLQYKLRHFQTSEKPKKLPI